MDDVKTREVFETRTEVVGMAIVVDEVDEEEEVAVVSEVEVVDEEVVTAAEDWEVVVAGGGGAWVEGGELVGLGGGVLVVEADVNTGPLAGSGPPLAVETNKDVKCKLLRDYIQLAGGGGEAPAGGPPLAPPPGVPPVAGGTSWLPTPGPRP